jgi:hypothetical protein
MPRFSAAFSRRKSTADEVQNALINPAEQQHSFRVIERSDVANVKSFDGGARLARASGNHLTRPGHLDIEQDDNMFAHLKGDRYVHQSVLPLQLHGHLPAALAAHSATRAPYLVPGLTCSQAAVVVPTLPKHPLLMLPRDIAMLPQLRRLQTWPL